MYYNEIAGIKVSALGMGNMRLPTTEERGPIDQVKAREIIEYAYDHGINFFDTAFRYHNGESETFVGEVLSQYSRDSFMLASKFPGHMMNFENHKLGFKGYLSDFHCDGLSDVFEEQLHKCKVDYFDFYLLHNMCESSYDFYTNEELGVVPYLLEQKKLGKIKHLCFSSHARAETIDKFLTKYPGVFDYCQLQLNYLDWTLQDAKTKYEVCVKHNIPVVVMEPVRGGRLIGLPEKAREALKAVEPTWTEAEWCFKFIQSLPNVAICLSGMTTLDQMKENLATYEEKTQLTEKHYEAIKAVVDEMLNMVPCTGCSYCTEGCPMEINIPKLISFYNESKNGGALLGFNMNRNNAGEDPAVCIGCGACMSVCPQGIKIPEILSEFTEMLDNK
jgi:uncharacterized protein